MYFNFKLNIMFYIGQQVVAIHDSKKGYFKKNQEFCVVDIIKCSCGGQYLNVGIIFNVPKNRQTCFCPKCKKVHSAFDFRYHESTYFAPIETSSYSIAIELVQELEQVDKQKIFNPKKVEI